MTEASPIWQGVLFVLAILLLAVETWRGWRAGVARAGINFAAVILSGLVGLFAARLAAAPFGGFEDPAGFVTGSLIGGGLALFMFVVLWLTGIIFFKRTDHQAGGVFRLVWGSGGAFFGFLMGLVIVWGGISIIRSLGALAEARVQIARDAAASPTHPFRPSPAPTPPPLASSLVKLKESLELGPAGQVVQSVDLLPPDFYDLIVQTARITGDPRALQRFFEYPGLEKLLTNPKFVTLINDPDFQKAGQNVNISTVASLLTNPKLRAIAEDPEVAEELKKIDLRAALKFALEKSSPSPSPFPGVTDTPSVPARD